MHRVARERRQAVTRKAMVAEVNETQSKQQAQDTEQEIQGLEIFLRRRLGMTSTEVSCVWRQYGTAGIALMEQAVYERDMATAHSHTQEEARLFAAMLSESLKEEVKQHENVQPKELKQHEKVQPKELKQHEQVQPEESEKLIPKELKRLIINEHLL